MHSVQPPADESWNGDQEGYRVYYTQLRYAALGLDESYQHVDVTYPQTEATLTSLVDQVVYEVKLTCYNGYGDGPSTGPLDIYVGEAGKAISVWLGYDHYTVCADHNQCDLINIHDMMICIYICLLLVHTWEG